MKRFVALFAVLSLFVGALALAAEVVAAQVYAGADVAVIEVEPGDTVGFKIRVTATGNLRNDITQTNPATVTVHTLFTVAKDTTTGVTAIGSSTPSSELKFWASGSGGQSSSAAPAAGYEVDASAVVAADAAPGDYTIRIAMVTFTPGSGVPPGQQLLDTAADYVTIRVVEPAGPAPDTEAPTGSITINAGATYTNDENVTLGLSATDNVGVTQYRIADGTDAAGATVVAEAPPATLAWTLPGGDGLKQVTVQYGDAAGNWSANYTASITLDKTPPVITVTTPAGAAVYLLNQEVYYDFTVTDATSGVASVTTTPAGITSGDAIDTSTVGAKTFTVNARDNAGNDATEVTRNYSVQYAFSGFGAPLRSNGNTTITMRGNGGTLPVKFTLSDAGGTAIGGLTIPAPRLFRVGTVGDGAAAGDTGDAALSTARADSGSFRWDAREQQYIFNLDARSLTQGVYLLQVNLPDGTAQYAYITIVR